MKNNSELWKNMRRKINQIKTQNLLERDALGTILHTQIVWDKVKIGNCRLDWVLKFLSKIIKNTELIILQEKAQTKRHSTFLKNTIITSERVLPVEL